MTNETLITQHLEAINDDWVEIPNTSSMYRINTESVIINSDGNTVKQFDSGNGYKKVRICGKIHFVHRLMGYAFLGLTDNMVIDHINGVRSDNRIGNLRVCTHRENCSFDNVKRNKKSKTVGVHFDADKNRWMAQITINNNRYSLGSHRSEQAAGDAYKVALTNYTKDGTLPIREMNYSSKHKGVFFCNTYKKWIAYYCFKNKNKRIGTFNTEIEAHNAYQDLVSTCPTPELVNLYFKSIQ